MDYETIDERMVSFELQAFSELFHSWAKDDKLNSKEFVAEKKKKRRTIHPVTKQDIILQKILDIRKVLLRPNYNERQRDFIPQEIILDDLQLCWHCIKYLRGMGKADSTITHFSLHVECEEIALPFPCLPASEQAIVNSRSTPKEDAIATTAERFQLGKDTVESIYKKAANRLGDETRLEWKLLAAIFLELNFYKDSDNQAKVLDCLVASGYSPTKLYYLVQVSHSINWQMSLGRWEQEQIDGLCKVVCPDNQGGPFAELL
jgi:hypothetical protein